MTIRSILIGLALMTIAAVLGFYGGVKWCGRELYLQRIRELNESEANSQIQRSVETLCQLKLGDVRMAETMMAHGLSLDFAKLFPCNHESCVDPSTCSEARLLAAQAVKAYDKIHPLPTMPGIDMEKMLAKIPDIGSDKLSSSLLRLQETKRPPQAISSEE